MNQLNCRTYHMIPATLYLMKKRQHTVTLEYPRLSCTVQRGCRRGLRDVEATKTRTARIGRERKRNLYKKKTITRLVSLLIDSVGGAGVAGHCRRWLCVCFDLLDRWSRRRWGDRRRWHDPLAGYGRRRVMCRRDVVRWCRRRVLCLRRHLLLLQSLRQMTRTLRGWGRRQVLGIASRRSRSMRQWRRLSISCRFVVITGRRLTFFWHILFFVFLQRNEETLGIKLVSIPIIRWHWN